MRILFIAIESGQTRLGEELAPEGRERFPLEVAEGLEAAREALSRERFDLVLFDMASAPGAVESLAAVVNRCIGTPLIVLVDENRTDLAERALRMGADQYCRREWLLHDFLLCMGQYVKRRALPVAENGRRPLRNPSDEDMRQTLELVSGLKRSPKGQAGSETSLKESSTELFDQYVRRFGDVLELALERALFRVDLNISRALEQLSEELGFLRATPKDMVEIYSAALEIRKRRGNEQRFKAYADEGRMLILEAMGHLVHFYRNNAVAAEQNRDGNQ